MFIFNIFIISEMLVFSFFIIWQLVKQNLRHTVLLPHTITSLQNKYTSDAKSDFFNILNKNQHDIKRLPY